MDRKVLFVNPHPYGLGWAQIQRRGIQKGLHKALRVCIQRPHEVPRGFYIGLHKVASQSPEGL